jgi:hypothetical protein
MATTQTGSSTVEDSSTAGNAWQQAAGSTCMPAAGSRRGSHQGTVAAAAGEPPHDPTGPLGCPAHSTQHTARHSTSRQSKAHHNMVMAEQELAQNCVSARGTSAHVGTRIHAVAHLRGGACVYVHVHVRVRTLKACPPLYSSQSSTPKAYTSLWRDSLPLSITSGAI